MASDLAVAALAGLAVGIEREWSGHASGPTARFAGARTFLLLGVLGGLAGWLVGGGLLAPGSLLLLAGIGLTVAAYVMAARRGAEHIEGTTEVAALVVLALGLVAGLGFPLLTSGLASVMVLVLVEKTRIHAAIKRLGEAEFAAALQFAVLALVILPVLPTGPYGPMDSIRPRAVWTAVLLFSGLNFAGYLARRTVGARRGYEVVGLIGGLVSSTAVTLQFSRLSRREPAISEALGAGVIGACTVLTVRLFLLSALLNPRVALGVVPYFAPVLLLGVGMLVVAWLRTRGGEPDHPPPPERSPLGLWAAIQLAAVFQAVLIAVPYAEHFWGTSGVLWSAFVLGLTDVDALTFAMVKLATDPAGIALGAEGIAVGVLSNTVFKVGIAAVLGSSGFRRVAVGGLIALGAASGAGFWLAH